MGHDQPILLPCPMNKTQLLYLCAFDVIEAEATVVDCRLDGDGCCIVLDQTVFYPGGGGQPADTGELAIANEVVAVEEVWLEHAGIVVHRLAAPAAALAIGTCVHMRVNPINRKRNCRLHSAGHVIDLAVHQLGHDWTPGKGAHFPHMAFVEYASDTPLAENAKELLQSCCDELIAAGSTNTIKFVDDSGAPVAQPNLGHMETARVVSYDGFDMACGGTHVADIAEIDTLVIKKVKRKKGVIKVSYTLQDL